MPPKPPKTNEKISLVAIEKYSRENISDKTAQIFLLSLREWRARRSKLPAEQIQQNVATVIASQPFVFSRIGPHHYQPRCHATVTGAQITHLLSEELRFVVGTHFSIETSWPPPLPAHHWITMVSLRGKEPISIVVQRLCSPAPPVGQSGGKAERERAFSGRCLSRCL